MVASLAVRALTSPSTQASSTSSTHTWDPTAMFTEVPWMVKAKSIREKQTEGEQRMLTKDAYHAESRRRNAIIKLGQIKNKIEVREGVSFEKED